MIRNCIILAALLGGLVSASAQITIPSDGSDGALNITESTVIDLTAATDADWNSSGTGTGVYDANQWAVVFKYSSVNIAPGATVTFKNHRTYAPVVWLVQGNVTIAGTLDLSGTGGVPSGNLVGQLTPAEPGPGGFRGGPRGPGGSGPGFGPGGLNTGHGSAGLYAGIYGNPQIIPLIGGSGSGGGNFAGVSGSAGGGAILVAASNTVTITGGVLAKGGNAGPNSSYGSGGAVRIVAATVSGGGIIDATDSLDGRYPGRIRIEANALAPSLSTAPETIRVSPANPPVIWPAANAPKVRVVSVDSVNAPVDPNARLIAEADVPIQNNGPVNIILEATNFPIEGVVQLTVCPKFGDRTTYTATRLDGNITASTWKVTTTLPQGFVTLQARATQP